MKKFINFLILPFLCCVSTIHASQHNRINEILRNISSEDKEILTELFQSLLLEDQFAYTLIGSKPMTHKGVFFDTDTKNFIPNWQVWKKYSHFFNEKDLNFAFLEKTYQELFEIHFVNKKLVIDTIEKHSLVFKEILGELSPNEILERILKSDDLFEAIGNSQILYGILLGYGEENARGFDLDLSNPIPFSNEKPKPNHLTLPYFQTFPSSQETPLLRKQYQLDRKKILSLYSKGNFLEITLTQFLLTL